MRSMKALVDKIRNEGTAIGTDIVKVDGFINHQLDVAFMEQLGREFSWKFDGEEVDLILTVEASGIAIACATAPFFSYAPVVVAKKSVPVSMVEDYYHADTHSATTGETTTLVVSKKFISSDNKVLILDDFLSHGESARALASIVKDAGAELIGIGVVIEKGFLKGGETLREMVYRVESLAVIDHIEDGNIEFR